MKYCLILIFTFNLLTTNAQLQTTVGFQTYDQLLEDLLVGYATDISNVTYSGLTEAIGTFNAENTTLGIDRGMIMTTGTIAEMSAGPHGPNDQPNAGLDNWQPSYSPLTQLVGVSTFNAAVLECDFVAISDTVKLEYIFGSDEYPEFVGSQFNDVFALFISGPGITDTVNMALIPGSSLAVNINTVNNGPSNSGPCNYCVYYNFNGNGDSQPHNGDSQYIQYDGFTTPLIAYSAVEPGETYHLTIAIADGGDGIYDSGIFLKTSNQASNLENHNVSKQMKLYPNPNYGSFIVESISEQKIDNIEVFGVEGKQIDFDLETLDAKTSKITFKYPAQGVYWIKILSKDGSYYSEKLVVQ